MVRKDWSRARTCPAGLAVVRLIGTFLTVAWVEMLFAHAADGQYLDGPLAFDTEIQARQAVDDYYEWLVGGIPDCIAYYTVTRDSPDNWRAGLFRPLCQFIPECRGDATLMDCFGGETVCVGYGLARKCRSRATVADRSRIIEGLAQLPPGEAATNNDWVAGQLVNLLLKNGQFDWAQNVADRCEASLWWCQALRGYVRHRRGASADGEAALDSALINAPPDLAVWDNTGADASEPGIRCSWTDVSMLLGESLRTEYESLPCEERAPFEARFWWLTDPAWSEPGNERRTEHFSRNVQLRLDDEIAPQRPNFRERIVREGWPNSWRAYQPRPHPREDPTRMTPELRERHEIYVRGGYGFTPDTETYLHPEASSAAAWTIEPQAEMERFVTDETWYDVIRRQTAVLRRDGRLLALTTALLPVITNELDEVDASLAVGRPADRTVHVTDGSVQAGVVRASAMVADGEWLASLEVRGRGWRGRLREGIPPPSLDGGFGVSAPIFVSQDPGLEEESLLARMLPTTELGGRSSVGLYFEVYGVGGGEGLQLSVAIEETSRSFLGRLGGFFGIGSSQTYAVDWTESADASVKGTLRRYLEISLDGLDEGEYEVRLSVKRGSGATATSVRRMTVG